MSEINKSKVLPRLLLSRGGEEGQANGCRCTEHVFVLWGRHLNWFWRWLHHSNYTPKPPGMMNFPAYEVYTQNSVSDLDTWRKLWKQEEKCNNLLAPFTLSISVTLPAHKQQRGSVESSCNHRVQACHPSPQSYPSQLLFCLPMDVFLFFKWSSLIACGWRPRNSTPFTHT